MAQTEMLLDLLCCLATATYSKTLILLFFVSFCNSSSFDPCCALFIYWPVSYPLGLALFSIYFLYTVMHTAPAPHPKYQMNFNFHFVVFSIISFRMKDRNYTGFFAQLQEFSLELYWTD